MVVRRLKTWFLALALTQVLVPRWEACGADYSVRIVLDRSKVSVGESVRMIVRVSGVRGRSPDPVVAGLEPFGVRRTGTSSSVRIINGNVDSSVEFGYMLEPKGPGVFRIGPARVTLEGHTYRSGTKTLKVVQGPPDSGDERGPLFLSASLSSAKAYVHGQTLYILKLYQRVPVSDLSLRLPESNAWTFKQLAEPTEYEGVYNGKTYRVLEVRYALIPSSPGVFGVRPAKMNLMVHETGKRPGAFGFFDDPLFSSARPRTLSSEPLQLQVLPLPEQGRPSDFSGLVGDFRIRAELKPRRVRAGESATLTVVVQGRGNVLRIPDLDLPTREGLKVYADRPLLKEEKDARLGIGGSKTMKWALVPEKEGRILLPALKVGFFDPEVGAYREAETEPLILTALAGKAEGSSPGAQPGAGTTERAGAKQAIEVLGRDILPPHTAVSVLREARPLNMTGPFAAAVLLAPGLIYLVASLGLRLRARGRKASAAVTARRAARKAVSACRRRNLTAEELSGAFRVYVNERFGLALGALTSEETRTILTRNGISAETVEQAASLVGELERAVFTGRGGDVCDMGPLVVETVQRIERDSR